MRRYVAEMIGTGGLVFLGCGSIIVANQFTGTLTHGGISATFGAVVMVMIYALGNVSGAHLNPAVTLAFFLAKKLDVKDLVPYILFQVLGGIIAMFLLVYVLDPSDVYGVTQPALPPVKAFVVEIMLTFVLMSVILNVSTGYKEKGIMAGVAVGLTVFLGALVGGPLTGASMNPARSLAPAIVAGNFKHLWLYLLGPTLGAILAIPTGLWLQAHHQNY